MLVCAIHQNRIVAYEFLEQGETMTSARYIQFLNGTLRRYIEENFTNQPSYHESYQPVILEDNARVHNSYATQEFIEERGWELLNHPAYSPDLNPLDYDVFNKLKRPLKGKRFNSAGELQNATIDSINQLNNNDSLIGTSNLVGRWQQVVDRNGQYIF